MHGSIQPDESPAEAARREVLEETGFAVTRLYHLRVHPFFVQATGTVQLAIVFAAFVVETRQPMLSYEHDRAEWLTVAESMKRFVWPSERESLSHAVMLLSGPGDAPAGPVEGVLRVP